MHTDILLEGTEKYYGRKFRLYWTNIKWGKWYIWTETRIEWSNSWIEDIRAIEFAP